MWNNKKPKVLIVEDDLSNHPLFLKAFEDNGFSVHILKSADDDFLKEVIVFMPDIISMDLMMGESEAVTERDGFDAIQMLKSNENTKEIPVIVLTNFFEEGKVQRAKELGAVDYISLQGQSINKVPDIFKSYLNKPKKFIPTHPIFRA